MIKSQGEHGVITRNGFVSDAFKDYRSLKDLIEDSNIYILEISKIDENGEKVGESLVNTDLRSLSDEQKKKTLNELATEDLVVDIDYKFLKGTDSGTYKVIYTVDFVVKDDKKKNVPKRYKHNDDIRTKKVSQLSKNKDIREGRIFYYNTKVESINIIKDQPREKLKELEDLLLEVKKLKDIILEKDIQNVRSNEFNILEDLDKLEKDIEESISEIKKLF